MNRVEFINHLQSLTVSTNYSELLKDNFGIEVPAGAPKYQQEYLYKYLMQARINGMSDEDLIFQAKRSVDRLIEKFPWLSKKYENIIPQPKVRKKKQKVFLKDGTIVFNEKTEKYEGFIDNKCVVRCASAEKTMQTMSKKFGIEY